MKPASNSNDDMLVPFLSVFLSVWVGVIGLSPCKGNQSRPEGIPESAGYNRKTNTYTAVEPGLEKVYFKSGEMVVEKQINELGIANGLYQSFSYRNKGILSKGNYAMGEKTGKWTWFFPSGKPYFEIHFSPGVRKKTFWVPILEWGNENGPYFRYYESGQIQEKGFYDGGNRSGDWVRYYPDTKIESKGSFEADKKVGEWLYFFPNGVKEAREFYDSQGVLQVRQLFRMNGSLRCEKKVSLEAICFP